MNELVEFERYMEHLCAGLGHSDRHAGLRGYCTGLMAPLKRKSVEPMASHLALTSTRLRHQSLHRFVAGEKWTAAVDSQPTLLKPDRLLNRTYQPSRRAQAARPITLRPLPSPKT